MEKIKSAILFAIFLLFSSCSGINSSDCESLDQACENYEIELIKKILNPELEGMEPDVNDSDKYGHEKNIGKFTERLSRSCYSMDFEVLCYACIYTLPPQSEIKITLNDGEERILDLRTPDDGPMEVIRIH